VWSSSVSGFSDSRQLPATAEPRAQAASETRMTVTARPTTINVDTGRRHHDKYNSANPIQRLALGRFHRHVYRQLDSLCPASVLDFGCGEGFFWQALLKFGPIPDVVGVDVRREAVETARAALPGLTFLQVDLFDFDPGDRRFDLVVASQVLEHLYNPAAYLERLCALTSERVLLTVPHEPFFQLCNLVRGRDLGRFGNHPEHVQRWSRSGFRRFASRYLVIEQLEAVFPFTLLTGRPR